MAELVDYSGPFDPDVNWESFSRDKLLGALKLYSQLFLAVDGFWYLAIKERFGDDVAAERDLWVWDKYYRYETKRIKALLNITGNDVEALMKINQFSPWTANTHSKFELIDKNHCVVRTVHCPTLEAMIKEGKGREQYFCDRVERVMAEMMGHAVNPAIELRVLRLPPETIGSDVCCEWEYVLPSEG